MPTHLAALLGRSSRKWSPAQKSALLDEVEATGGKVVCRHHRFDNFSRLKFV